jgi:uncharacterized protein YxjI
MIVKPPQIVKIDYSKINVFTAGTIDQDNSEDWQSQLCEPFINDDNIVLFNPRRENWDSSWENELVDTKSDTLNLPNKFNMDEVIMTIGTDMELSSDDQNLGKIEERIVSWGKTFEYITPNGTKLAYGKQRVVSLVTTIDIFDEKDRKIGTFREELFENFFSIKTHYSIKDSNGKLIGESEKLDWLSTNVEIYSPNRELICKLKRSAFNLISDSWTVEIMGNIDKRLVIFIPCYKTSSDNEREDEDNKKNRD